MHDAAGGGQQSSESLGGHSNMEEDGADEDDLMVVSQDMTNTNQALGEKVLPRVEGATQPGKHVQGRA